MSTYADQLGQLLTRSEAVAGSHANTELGAELQDLIDDVITAWDAGAGCAAVAQTHTVGAALGQLAAGCPEWWATVSEAVAALGSGLSRAGEHGWAEVAGSLSDHAVTYADVPGDVVPDGWQIAARVPWPVWAIGALVLYRALR